MNMKASMALLLMVLFVPAVYAGDEIKRTLNLNMTEDYHIEPRDAVKFGDIFTRGIYYGRIRSNYFRFNWSADTHFDPKGFGVGGSLIYKTAPYHGVSGTIGFYMSHNLGVLDNNDALYGRTGRDTFSRYNVLENGTWGMTVLAQSYFRYHYRSTDIKLGRQIFESFLTKSNDTKMIPNTFNGVTVTSREIPETTVTFGYLTQQKLRDHTEFHDVITYGDATESPYGKWNNQDDSAGHRGLSHENLKSAGKDVNNSLIVAGISNGSVGKLQLDMWYTGVPELFYSVMGEANYRIPMTEQWILVPGIRYMRQFDSGAGDIGGAALSGILAGQHEPAHGYSDPDSVDSSLFAARIVLNKGAGKYHLGYSVVSDDADLITPWRGFPTGGYTRSMAQYNWEANTTSYMVQLSYDFNKAKIVKGLRTSLDYVYTDYDDTKEQTEGLTKSHSSYIHADVMYALPLLPALELKGRLGIFDIELNTEDTDLSYSEFRLEMNYLF